MAEEVGYVESPPELGALVAVGIIATIILVFVVIVSVLRR